MVECVLEMEEVRSSCRRTTRLRNAEGPTSAYSCSGVSGDYLATTR